MRYEASSTVARHANMGSWDTWIRGGSKKGGPEGVQIVDAVGVVVDPVSIFVEPKVVIVGQIEVSVDPIGVIV